MKSTVYVWGVEKKNVLHIYAGLTTQKNIDTRLNGVKNIIVGPSKSRFVGAEGRALGSENIEIIYANTSDRYSRHKEQKAINSCWHVEEQLRAVCNLPVRSLNTNRSTKIKSYDEFGITNRRYNSVYGHVLAHRDELSAQSSKVDAEIVRAVTRWVKSKVDASKKLKAKFGTSINKNKMSVNLLGRTAQIKRTKEYKGTVTHIAKLFGLKAPAKA